MKKYNIENFYIGELCLSREFGNLLVRTALSEEEKSQIEIRLITKCNGAIEINNYIDWSARRNYVSLFTLFYKENEQYICLHNNNVYSTNGFDHCQNLIPLSTVLPKVSSTIPNELSINFVLYSAIIACDKLLLKEYSTTSVSAFLHKIIPTLGFSCGFFTSLSNASK